MKQQKTFEYLPHMTRRQSLKWMGAMAASAALPGLVSCSPADKPDSIDAASAGHWPDVKLTRVTATGYGKDPNLIVPPRAAWPRVLTSEQLTAVALVSDILVPRDGRTPSASEVGVPDVIDEWVSAPYERQQADRADVIPLLQWLEDESSSRFNRGFNAVSEKNRLAIIDDIAGEKAISPEFTRPASAFSKLRNLAVAAFFCSPEGSTDIGYMGNVAIAGDYPGPTEEARAHLNTVLKDLGLTEFAWKGIGS